MCGVFWWWGLLPDLNSMIFFDAQQTSSTMHLFADISWLKDISLTIYWVLFIRLSVGIYAFDVLQKPCLLSYRELDMPADCLLMLFNLFLYPLFFLRFYLFIFRKDVREGEKGRETSIGCFLCTPWSGTEPATQACALTGNRTATFCFVTDAQPTEPHQPGLSSVFLLDLRETPHSWKLGCQTLGSGRSTWHAC